MASLAGGVGGVGGGKEGYPVYAGVFAYFARLHPLCASAGRENLSDGYLWFRAGGDGQADECDVAHRIVAAGWLAI